MSQGAGSVWKVPLAVSLDTESCTTSVSPMPRRSKRAGRVGRAAEIQGIDEEFYMGVAAQQAGEFLFHAGGSHQEGQ